MGSTAEQRGWASLFWAAFECSRNPMMLLTTERVVVAINPAWQELTGYRADDLVGRRSDLQIAPESLGQLERDWRTLRRIGQVDGRRDLILADGRRRHIQFAAQREVVTGRHLVLFVVLDAQLAHSTTVPLDAAQQMLTRRELEVVGEIAMGRRTREIAERLFISPNTVAKHVRNAMAKVGARSQAQLVAIALSTGMLDSEELAQHVATMVH